MRTMNNNTASGNTLRTLLTFAESTRVEDTYMVSTLKEKGLRVIEVNYDTGEVVMATTKFMEFDSMEDITNYVLAFGGRVFAIESEDSGEILYRRDEDYRWNETLHCFEEE